MRGLADVMSTITYIYSVHLADWYHMKADIWKTICVLNIKTSAWPTYTRQALY